jgi:hypothetical protein
MEEGAPVDSYPSIPSVVRTFDEEMRFIRQDTPTKYTILPGFVPNMRLRHKCIIKPILCSSDHDVEFLATSM